MANSGNKILSGNVGDNLPVIPPLSAEYEQAKILDFSLGDRELERLGNELRGEIEIRAQELVCREKRRRLKIYMIHGR